MKHPTKKIGRFALTGLLALIVALPLSVVIIQLFLRLSGFGTWSPSDQIVWSNATGGVYWIVFFLVSCFISSRRWALCGRWACTLFYLLWVLLIVLPATLTPPTYTAYPATVELTTEVVSLGMTLIGVLAPFYGGMLGDHRRKRREVAQLRGEAKDPESQPVVGIN